MKLRLPSPLAAALFTAATVTLFCTSACQTAPAVDPALLNPATNSAIRPETRDPKWVKRHEGFVAQAKPGAINVLFLGDSITDSWRDEQTAKTRGGKRIWDANFGSLRAANFGISGDRTQHVLWRLQNGELEGVTPKVVVLMIGTNNTGFENDKVTPRNSVAETTEGVRAVVRTLRTKLPQTKILLLAIFPRDEKPTGLPRQQVDAINRNLVQFDEGRSVRYLDINANFLAADGTLPKDVMPDFLHPNEHGYQIWADAIRAPLAELLK